MEVCNYVFYTSNNTIMQPMLRKYLSKELHSVFYHHQKNENIKNAITCGWIPIDMVHTTNDLFHLCAFMFKVDELILYLGGLESDITKTPLVASSFTLSVVLSEVR